ncbi:MAG: AfsR/SARP family transcriptional regulator, partial [Gemmatimonadaceae bacterium]
MTRRKSGEEQRSAVRLVLRTLGTFEGSSETEGGERLGRFGPGKPLSLLVYLAHSPNRGAPRDHLVELLWGDVDTDAARHALRQTIWYVRRTLGDGVLDTDGDVVRLAAWCDSDAHDFVRAVDAHDEDKALALYTGDFLPSIAVPGGAEFERWADLERLRLRSIFTRTAEARVLHYLSRGGGGGA